MDFPNEIKHLATAQAPTRMSPYDAANLAFIFAEPDRIRFCLEHAMRLGDREMWDGLVDAAGHRGVDVGRVMTAEMKRYHANPFAKGKRRL